MAAVFESAFVFLIIAILMYFAFRKSSGCCGGHQGSDHTGTRHSDPTSGQSGKKRDPVCGMEVEAGGSSLNSTYQGRTAYFCSTNCKDRFDRNPERYAESHDAVHHGHGGCCA